MKRVLPAIVIAVAAIGGAALWHFYGPSELERARQDLCDTCDELQAAHPELLSDPRKFYEREGTNAYRLCLEIEAKLDELGDVSGDDERGDWWFPFEMGPENVNETDEAEIDRLLTIALEESEPLIDDVERVLDCDYLLVTPDDEFDFDTMVPVWIAMFLGNRIEAHCRLGQVDSARREAEMLIRLIAMTDSEASTLHMVFYLSMSDLAWRAMTSVTDVTRDAEWFNEWRKPAQPEADYAAALRNERGAIYERARLFAEKSDKALEDAVEWSFLYEDEFQSAAEMLQSHRVTLVELFRFVDEFADNELDLTNPETTSAIVEHIESVEDSFIAFALGLIVERMEEGALDSELLTVAYELRSLELAGHALSADAPKVKDLLKGHPGIELKWRDDGATIRTRFRHLRTTPEEETPMAQYEFLAKQE